MRSGIVTLVPILLTLFQGPLAAQEFEFYPGASYDPSIPTLEEIVGHSWGEKITMHHEVEKYLTALAAASPRVRMVEYGKTWEDRALNYLIVASESNMGRLTEIKDGLWRLANPDSASGQQAQKLIDTLPSVVWLAYGVHGNEISSTDAALLTAYHIASATNDTLAREILSNTIVIIDPMQNPDGRDRFISYFRQTRGRWSDENQQAAEHREDWPGGRTNHYLFDMNRDWFALTQPETRGRVSAYLEWYPQVFVDLHEMGSNSTYYFAPPADPLNPEIPSMQLSWLKKFGQNNATWFDKMGFDYFTREIYDSFYPGYGEGWPMFNGSIGMTYEQASVRGLVVRRADETILHYRESVNHHFISSLSTAQTTARNRAALLKYFYEYRLSAIEEGKNGEIKEFIIKPGGDPNRVAKLATQLVHQGIRVKYSTKPFNNGKVRDYNDGAVKSGRFPIGSYVITLAQPSKRLVKNLLAKNIQMDAEFISEQLRRQKKRIGDQIYDVTGWSLPLLYDVECFMAYEPSGGDFKPLKKFPDSSTGFDRKATLAYLIPWGTNSAAKALARLFREDIRVYSSDKPFSLNKKKYPSGTLIIKVRDNKDDLYEKLVRIAREEMVEIHPTNTSWVEEGVNFGSSDVGYLKKPKIAMAYNEPTSAYSTGWTRFLLEQVYGYPVTIIRTTQLPSVDLTKFNVLLLPNSRSGYDDALSGASDKIKDWIRAGGTLIAYGQALRWLTNEKVGLLATNRELKGGMPDIPQKESNTPQNPAGQDKEGAKPFDVEEAIQPDRELPTNVPGAILRISLDAEHWLAAGYDGDAYVMVQSRNIFTPLKLDKGRNVGLYMSEDKILASGFIWEDSRKQLAGKAYLMHQPHGSGHVIAFAEDPNFRSFIDGLNLLLLNAVFLGPSH